MCSTNSPGSLTTWRESGQITTVWAEFPADHPLTGQEFWEFHPESWVPPGLSQECQTERSGRPGCSSAAVRPTPSDVLLVVLSSRSEETWFNVSACRNTLDIQSGQQNPTLIWTPNTTLLLDLMNAAFNSLWEVRNPVFASKYYFKTEKWCRTRGSMTLCWKASENNFLLTTNWWNTLMWFINAIKANRRWKHKYIFREDKWCNIL